MTNIDINRYIYINPDKPSFNLATPWMPRSLTSVFGKMGLYNPHLIMSDAFVQQEGISKTITEWRAMERSDNLWDVVEFKKHTLSGNGLRDTFVNCVFAKPEQTVMASSLSRDVAQKIIDEFNASIQKHRASSNINFAHHKVENLSGERK